MPGDTVIVSATYGGWNILGIYPKLYLGRRPRLILQIKPRALRGQAILRLTPGLFQRGMSRR